MERTSPQPEQGHDEARALFSRLTRTTLVLFVMMLVVFWFRLVSEKLSMILFSILFAFDFSFQAFLIWKHKLYWMTPTHDVVGNKARIISAIYGFVALSLLAFAILTIAR